MRAIRLPQFVKKAFFVQRNRRITMNHANMVTYQGAKMHLIHEEAMAIDELLY
jgi:hypothetical protein